MMVLFDKLVAQTKDYVLAIISIIAYWPVDEPTAPISTAGMAITIQPPAAAKDRTCDVFAVLQAKTRWK
jgi:hypothetical protein